MICYGLFLIWVFGGWVLLVVVIVGCGLSFFCVLGAFIGVIVLLLFDLILAFI